MQLFCSLMTGVQPVNNVLRSLHICPNKFNIHVHLSPNCEKEICKKRLGNNSLKAVHKMSTFLCHPGLKAI